MLSAPESKDRWLERLAVPLWIIAFLLSLAFAYFASSLCISVLLSAFLAIVIDPLVTFLERRHVARMLSSAAVILGGIAVIGGLVYGSYQQISNLIDDLPIYAERVEDAVAPITKKIEKVQNTAGKLNATVPARKVQVVQLKQQYPEWTTYLIRGVGSLSGVIIIVGVVPFLMFFILLHKARLKQKLTIVWGDRIDVAAFASSVTTMVRGFVIGNLIIGLAMAGVTALVLFVLGTQGAILLGVVSGFLNLLPFLGAIAGSVVVMGAALMQGQSLTALLVILATIIALHTIAANFLIPRIVGTRVSISPVAATVAILFWGWLWGMVGVLMAVPLTAFVKIVCDAHPSLGKIGNLLAEKPSAVPSWSPEKRESPREVPGLRHEMLSSGVSPVRR